MRFFFYAAFLASTLGLGGCGSLLASLQVDTIAENRDERTIGRMVEDSNIETKSIVNLHAEDEAFHDSHIVVVSFNGYVLIAGQVNSEALKAKATAVVRDVRGVRRIYNELEIAAPSSAMTRASDTWITTKVKSTLIGAQDTEGTRVKVVTEDGVVFLMGLVTRAEAERIAAKAADIAGVQRVVRLFELID
ncbi:MAG: BON domain-containing protein [Halioglobus sp.]|nr:BON domain-containing protein [Halioglobus sp.]